jgi:hypothetical protein
MKNPSPATISLRLVCKADLNITSLLFFKLLPGFYGVSAIYTFRTVSPRKSLININVVLNYLCQNSTVIIVRHRTVFTLSFPLGGKFRWY